MSDLRKNCNQGQQKQTLRISSPPRLLDRLKTPACLGLNIDMTSSTLTSSVNQVEKGTGFKSNEGEISGPDIVMPLAP